jgi:hypothetical protein
MDDAPDGVLLEAGEDRPGGVRGPFSIGTRPRSTGSRRTDRGDLVEQTIEQIKNPPAATRGK